MQGHIVELQGVAIQENGVILFAVRGDELVHNAAIHSGVRMFSLLRNKG
jgi:hypothetical protein